VRRRAPFSPQALLLLVALAAALAPLVLLASSGSSGLPRALGQTPSPGQGEVTPQTDGAVPARELLMLGSSPQEAPQEAWAVGDVGSQSVPAAAIVHYIAGEGWTLAPQILDGGGQPLGGFEPVASPLAGAIAPNGGGALLGEAAKQQLLLVREPGGAFAQTATAAPLETNQRLYDPSLRRAPMVAVLEEGSGSAGALVVPVGAGASNEEASVLHWSAAAHEWTVEPIEVPLADRGSGFEPLAISASSPENAWLLARLTGSNAVGLFHRVEGGGAASWQPVSPGAGEEPGAALEVPLKEGAPTPLATLGAGGLTVSAKGVWVDGLRSDTLTPITMFFQPQGAAGGQVLASWCGPTSGGAPCTHTLAESLPTGSSRSFAWSGGGQFGERVITGLGEGVSLRLEGEEFARVLALGSSTTMDVGASRGAAFASAKEGWLGSDRLPVHLTLEPQASRLQPYPVPFRHSLVAIAPQPGAPIGARSSEALAVGAEGEVARYSEATGWQPESLLNIAGVRQTTPQLRAVAWPRAGRAYAVGIEQMWLWRGETGLWEKDPAAPLNFRGDLLGIAFDPANASRGYAVGQAGVLLRYGKSWTQEPTCGSGVPEPCLPPEVADASFTSIAFAGSEAIVAFRVPRFEFSSTKGSQLTYTGGLLVNAGAGWQVDPSATAALAGEAENLPWAVAGLADGGAAFSSTSGGGVPHVFERNGAGSAWEATQQPYPGLNAPGSLALFREAGALRAIGSGSAPNTTQADEQPPPPVGFPPKVVHPYPIGGELPTLTLRQTASGWSEEEHEHDEIGPPLGSYKRYDKGYAPDPVWAMEVGPAGEAGWAVGGFLSVAGQKSGLETSDIARYSYPSMEDATPPGVGRSPVAVVPNATTALAIGGGAQCAAPCAARAEAQLGPDAGLKTALRQAHAAGADAFLYTGPRVTTGATSVKATLEVPYAEEFGRYAKLLAEGGAVGTELYASPVPSPTDYVQGSLADFDAAFSGALTEEFKTQPCGPNTGCYAFTRGAVRVIVIDDSATVESAQLAWLGGELANAARESKAAIVVGNANLNVEAAHNEANAAQTIATIAAGNAAAYFFDAPEQNIHLVLPGSTIPAFGSGTLGYVSLQSSQLSEFIGASGFLLAEVGAFHAQSPGHPNAAVSVELIPNIGEGPHGEGELALEAQQGTLLRRSEVAKFAALARKPRAGNEASENNEAENFAYLFTPIPAECQGAVCPGPDGTGGQGILPEYSFESSKEHIGRFVKPELGSAEANAVAFNAKTGEPEFEGGPNISATPVASKSGLFCALNPGETEVTINAGGFSATLKVIVQKGSVRRPCGTTPATAAAAQEQTLPAPVPPPAPAPAPAPAPTPPLALPLPPPPTLAVVPPRPLRAPSPPPFFSQPLLPFAAVPFVPPPPPAPANPSPPSGTSAVTSPVEAAQKEEEREEATESVSNQAVAYRSAEHEPVPAYLLGIVLLAAFAGAAGARRRPRRGRQEARVAPATISGSRAQRRLGDGRRR
jgi:hypothetical protein